MKELQLKLFMVLLGANPKGRFVEQHDYFFGVAGSLKELVPAIKAAWADAGNTLHLDGWREVNVVEGYQIIVAPKEQTATAPGKKLFFINLGGYQTGKLEEQHYVMLTVQDDRLPAVKESMRSLFYKTNNSPGAHSHIDEKFGVDVDDMYRIEDILSPEAKEKYQLIITPGADMPEDEIHLGYFKLDKLVLQ
jgi:hypothetical protein